MKTFEFYGDTYTVDDKYNWVGIDENGEVWAFVREPVLHNDHNGDYWDTNGVSGVFYITTRVYVGPAEARPISPAAAPDFETVTIKMPVGMKDWFISMMSCSAEQGFMEWYHDSDVKTPGTSISFDYPYFANKRGESSTDKCDIVIQTHEE